MFTLSMYVISRFYDNYQFEITKKNISLLSEKTLLKIFQFIDKKEIRHISLTNKKFYNITNTDISLLSKIIGHNNFWIKKIIDYNHLNLSEKEFNKTLIPIEKSGNSHAEKNPFSILIYTENLKKLVIKNYKFMKELNYYSKCKYLKSDADLLIEYAENFMSVLNFEKAKLLLNDCLTSLDSNPKRSLFFPKLVSLYSKMGEFEKVYEIFDLLKNIKSENYIDKSLPKKLVLMIKAFTVYFEKFIDSDDNQFSVKNLKKVEELLDYALPILFEEFPKHSSEGTLIPTFLNIIELLIKLEKFKKAYEISKKLLKLLEEAKLDAFYFQMTSFELFLFSDDWKAFEIFEELKKLEKEEKAYKIFKELELDQEEETSSKTLIINFFQKKLTELDPLITVRDKKII